MKFLAPLQVPAAASPRRIQVEKHKDQPGIEGDFISRGGVCEQDEESRPRGSIQEIGSPEACAGKSGGIA
jgi:hypothetical protein